MIRQILQPPGWPRPSGYSNGIAAEGRQVFISGQIGWNAEQKFASDELAAQVRQALANVVEVLACAGGRPVEHAQMIPAADSSASRNRKPLIGPWGCGPAARRS